MTAERSLANLALRSYGRPRGGVTLGRAAQVSPLLVVVDGGTEETGPIRTVGNTTIQSGEQVALIWIDALGVYVCIGAVH